jgi:hypothetical protein
LVKRCSLMKHMVSYIAALHHASIVLFDRVT